MLTRTSPYWSIVSQVIDYAVDTGVGTTVRHEGRTIVKIDLDKFIADLYVLRIDDDFEEVLVNRMMYSTPVVCLIGSRGCGKTSTLAYAVQQIRLLEPAWQCITLDIKSLFYQKGFDSLKPSDATRCLRCAIREQVMDYLFPLKKGEEFIAWALAGPPDESDDFDRRLVADLADQSLSLLSKVRIASESRVVRRAAILDWFQHGEDRYGETFNKVVSDLRTAHVVQAAVRILPKTKRIVLIFDNVDRIPAQYQPNFMEAVNDEQIALGGLCTSVIAIRKENVRSLRPRDGAGGDYLAYIGPSDEAYPARLMPRTSIDHVKKVLEKRHGFVQTLYNACFAEYEQQLALKDADHLHNAVVGEFMTHSVHSLANGSLRTVIEIYRSFAEYLLVLVQQKYIKLEHLSGRSSKYAGYLQTLFFLWLKTQGSSHDITLYDMHKVMNQIDEVNDFTLNASEHHLLLACIFNLSPIDPGNLTNYPTFGDVYERLQDLGFSFSKIHRAFLDMCSRPGDPPRLVEFCDREDRIEDLNENSECRVRLTTLGAEVVVEIFNKVGYAWELAEKWAKENRELRKVYFQLTRKERISILYDYLCHRARVHLKLMFVLKDRLKIKYEDQWLDAYRKIFGIRGKVQIERILESARRFYKPDFAEAGNPFLGLLEAYRALLVRIGIEENFDELQLDELERFRNLDGLRQRSQRSKGRKSRNVQKLDDRGRGGS